MTTVNVSRVSGRMVQAAYLGSYAGGSVPIGQITSSFPQTTQTTVQIQYFYNAQDATGFEYSLNGGAWGVTGKPLSLSNLTSETTYNVKLRPTNEIGPGQEHSISFRTRGEAAPPLEDDWRFSKRINPLAPRTWEHGSRHPSTGMRVRMFK